MATSPSTSPRLRRRRIEPPAVVVPVGLHLRVSPAQLEAFCDANPDLHLERTAEGRLVIMWPAGAESSGQNADLIIDLGIWARADGTGRIFESSVGFTLPNGARVGPDAAWVQRDRWDAVPAEQKKRFPALVPDFVIELRSPSDRLGKLQSKMRQYIEQGVRLAWLIDPKRQRVAIYRPGREPEIQNKPATLSGEDVLPGLTLDLRGILSD